MSALAIREAAMTAYTRPLQDLPGAERDGRPLAVYDLFRVTEFSTDGLQDAVGLRQRLREVATPSPVPVVELVRPMRVPQVADTPREIRFPVTSALAAHVSHWVHILWLNHLIQPVLWAEYLTASRWRFLRLAWRARSLDPQKIIRRCNILGDAVEVDETAVLEGCVIRDRAQIGARVTLRNCLIGEDAVVADDSRLINCAIGRGGLILPNAFMVNCATYPRATLSSLRMQQSLFGEETFLTYYAALFDAKFDGDVSVWDGEAYVSAGTPFLGSCLGHRVRLGPHVMVLHGRAVPNDTWIVMPPEDIVRNIPPDLPPQTPVVVRGGTLVPLT